MIPSAAGGLQRAQTEVTVQKAKQAGRWMEGHKGMCKDLPGRFMMELWQVTEISYFHTTANLLSY